jgi:hypothetical protein
MGHLDGFLELTRFREGNCHLFRSRRVSGIVFNRFRQLIGVIGRAGLDAGRGQCGQRLVPLVRVVDRFRNLDACIELTLTGVIDRNQRNQLRTPFEVVDRSGYLESALKKAAA